MKKFIAVLLSILLVSAFVLSASAVTQIPVKSIKTESTKITMKVGETKNLKVIITPDNSTDKTLTYVSGNKSIATVSNVGKITGVKEGQTDIAVFTGNKKVSTKCSVIVSKTDKKKAVMLKNGDNIKGMSEADKKKHMDEVMEKSIAPADPNPVVGIGRGTDFASVTEKAVENAGGLKNIIKKGGVVLIKPNICTEYIDYGAPEITDYRIVQKVADMAYKLGASRVIVAEGSFYGNIFDYDGNGYKLLTNVELFNFNDCTEKNCYKLKPKNSLVGKAIFIPKIYMDADVVIDIAKMKTHFLTWVSLSLKNCIGIPSAKIYGVSGDKSGVHMLGLENAIVDINRIRKPDFSIIDGITAGEGYGPVGNTPVKANIILAGKDPVALDTVGLTFMGGKLDECSHIMLAGKNGLGVSDISKIKITGADLDKIKMKFRH